MQHHPVLAEHTAAPGTAHEAHVYGACFLNYYIESPGLELLLNPLLGIGKGGRPHDTAAYHPVKVVGMHHGLIVRAAEFQDFGNNLVLRRNFK